jgi:hypothetical protein
MHLTDSPQIIVTIFHPVRHDRKTTAFLQHALMMQINVREQFEVLFFLVGRG